jgi:adenine deaminase
MGHFASLVFLAAATLGASAAPLAAPSSPAVSASPESATGAGSATATAISHLTTATIWTGGTILTMAGAQPETVEALAVRDGRLLAVGTLTDVRRAAGKTARSVDLKGRTLLPGFIDSHGHVCCVWQAAA